MYASLTFLSNYQKIFVSSFRILLALGKYLIETASDNVCHQKQLFPFWKQLSHPSIRPTQKYSSNAY